MCLLASSLSKSGQLPQQQRQQHSRLCRAWLGREACVPTVPYNIIIKRPLTPKSMPYMAISHYYYYYYHDLT